MLCPEFHQKKPWMNAFTLENFANNCFWKHQKVAVTATLVINILELHSVLIQVRLATSKSKFYIQYNKLGMRVASPAAAYFKTQDLSKLGYIRKMSNLGDDIAQCPASFLEIKLWLQQSKKYDKVHSKIFYYCPVLLFSLICSKYFVRNCGQLQSIFINLSNKSYVQNTNRDQNHSPKSVLY